MLRFHRRVPLSFLGRTYLLNQKDNTNKVTVSVKIRDVQSDFEKSDMKSDAKV